MSAGARRVSGRRRRAQTLTRRFRLRRNSRLALRPSPRLIAAVAGLVLVLGAGFLWFRDSSLVAVKRVQVIGASGPDAGLIRAALVAAAHNMTTMDVNAGQLHTAVAPYPDVKSLQVSTRFPHGMRIRVIEQIPVAMVTDGGRRIAVAGDGTLLYSSTANSALPVIPLRVAPGGPRLTGYALAEVQLLSNAPYQLLPRIITVTDGPLHGLAARLRNGPVIYFGDSSSPAAKWSSATAVLANSGSADASYVDVTDPNRPAAGAGSDGGAATSSATGAGTATTSAANGGGTVAGSSATGAGTATTSAGTSAQTATTSAGTSAQSPGTATSAPAGVSTTPAGG
jgi:cell division protein FtsQ